MWSPRELAELAGTSRRAVRHYADIGLLPEPDRGPNGYGRYGVDHLVRLVRIRRLVDLGLSLPQISTVGDADRLPEQMVRGLDAELADEIERIRRARSDLSTLLARRAPIDVPPEVEQHVSDLPDADRTLVVVLSRLLSAPALSAYLEVLAHYRDHAAVRTFDRLAPDAGSRLRATTAQRLARHVGDVSAAHPEHVALVQRELRRGVPPRQRTLDEAVKQLYNPAQLDVLARVRLLQANAARVDRQAI